ncbi:hypothetical protein [Achromobacter sp.]|uniref:hypothetical protein n=1 Tax=Achromobacter sp. TaxID=134375 RepID=UPI00258EA1A9|nr:hypothetical protein [Achromobacter sp.]
MTQMTADQQNRYDDLVSRYVDLDDEEKAELDGLVKTVKEAKAKRKAAIEDIQKKLKAVEPAFTLQELFGDELKTILKAEGYGAVSTARATKTAGKTSGTKASVNRESDNNPIGILINEGGRPFQYKLGRVDEAATEQNKQPWAIVPQALIKHAQTVENLKKFTTPETAQHWASKDGEAELKKIVEIAKKAKAKEDEKSKTSIKDDAAKQAAKADAKAAAAA